MNCPECWSTGVLEYWAWARKAFVLERKRRAIQRSLRLVFFHYSITPLLQKTVELRIRHLSPLWGQVKATSSGRGSLLIILRYGKQTHIMSVIRHNSKCCYTQKKQVGTIPMDNNSEEVKQTNVIKVAAKIKIYSIFSKR